MTHMHSPALDLNWIPSDGPRRCARWVPSPFMKWLMYANPTAFTGQVAIGRVMKTLTSYICHIRVTKEVVDENTLSENSRKSRSPNRQRSGTPSDTQKCACERGSGAASCARGACGQAASLPETGWRTDRAVLRARRRFDKSEVHERLWQLSIVALADTGPLVAMCDRKDTHLGRPILTRFHRAVRAGECATIALVVFMSGGAPAIPLHVRFG